MAKLDERIGFIGGGNMAFAIGYGLINRGTSFVVVCLHTLATSTNRILNLHLFYFIDMVRNHKTNTGDCIRSKFDQFGEMARSRRKYHRRQFHRCDKM